MKIIEKLLFISAICIVLAGCGKEYDAIGLNLKEGELLGNAFSDSTSITAYTVKGDSISTKQLSNSILGYIQDPDFGTTRASIYTQFSLTGSSVNFGVNPELDSIVLILQYTGFYGDTNARLTARVHELTEGLSNSTSQRYFSNSTTNFDATNLTYNPSFSFTPRPHTPVLIENTKRPAQLRIRLSDELGQHFIDNQNRLGTNDDFLNFFKGLHLTVSGFSNSGTGCLVYLNLRNDISAITMYYRNQEGNKTYSLRVTGTSAYYNNFSHDYTTSNNQDLKDQVLSGNKEKGKQTLFVQPMGGVKTFIQFPNLYDTFKDQKIVINKAELVISNITIDDNAFPSPAQLNLQLIKQTGGLGFVPDDSDGRGSTYFGGTYDKNKKEYRIRVTRYVQQLLTQKISPAGLYIVTRGEGIAANRLIFAGPESTQNPEQQFRLELDYTTY